MTDDMTQNERLEKFRTNRDADKRASAKFYALGFLAREGIAIHGSDHHGESCGSADSPCTWNVERLSDAVEFVIAD